MRVESLVSWTFMVAFCISTLVIDVGRSALAAAPTESATRKLHDCDRSLLDVWLTARSDALNIPGLAVAIVHDQDVLYCRGFGYADLERKTEVTPQTLFRVASLSKLFTAIAIMQLRDAGKLTLDDDASQRLPWLKLTGPQGDSATVTIRQLLTHTSGLSSLALSERPFWSDYRFPRIEELRRDLAKRRLAFPPGEQLKYSNLGYALLGEIVETASQQTYVEYVEDRVLRPLDMTASRMAIAADAPNLAHGYGPLRANRREPIPFMDAESLAPATGLAASASDLAKFMRWQIRLLNSDVTDVIAASTLREMQTTHRVNADWSFGQGYSFRIMRKADRELIGHGGEYPGFWSFTMINPKQKLGVVVLANCMQAPVISGVPGSITDGIVNMLEPILNRANQPAQFKKIAAWDRYTGRYRSIWGDLYVMQLEDRLVAFNPKGDTPASTMYKFEPIKSRQNRFRTIESTDAFFLHEEFFFEDFREGKAQTFRVPGAIYKRVEMTR